jgi:hypothetical protein
MFSTIEILDTVHLGFVSLAVIDAFLFLGLCEQVIVFILGRCERRNAYEK